ncbi:MAG TPA: methyltransferase domain-containing protein [Bryobacteraceae bacterium]|nr:methyltransferase domain-containing protein [Bryobacteraceae bacterium]
MTKSTPEQIRARFDKDVERFSNLETGQSATIDAPLSMELIAQAAASTTPNAAAMVDIGCGAGNLSLKLRQFLPSLEVTLIDLSLPMLERATERLGGRTRAIQGDIREVELAEESVDIAVGAAVFHHLRGEPEWRSVFGKVYRSLRPGGSFWISDLISHSMPAVQELMWSRYGDYLTGFKGEEYRRHVFEYVEYEDTPRPLLFQIDLLRECGFSEVEILHKNSCFAAFGARKG